MYQFLSKKKIKTTLTFESLSDFDQAYANKEIDFPVFVKPRRGSGSVGIHKIFSHQQLQELLETTVGEFIIQEFMSGDDCDTDVYVDCVSGEVISIFGKKKIETREGGASKTISFKDEKLFETVKKVVKHFNFYGPIDIDFFYQDGEYILSEINPRFGGAYIHAYGTGVDFFKYIIRNIKGLHNNEEIGQYEEDILMMMYDAVVIKKKSELIGGEIND